MSAFKLRRTFPPPAIDEGVAKWPPIQQQRVSASPAAAEVEPEGSSPSAAITEEERSAVLSEAMQQAGFVLSNVRTHFVFAEVLESMWSNFGFSFTGNFTEGWGYSLYAMNGRPGFDSAITCRYIMQEHLVHFEDCACPNRGPLTCHISEQTGLLQLSRETIPIMKRMGLVVSVDGEVLDVSRTNEVKHKVTLSRSSANPEVHFTEQLNCCPHFANRAAQSLQRLHSLPGDWQSSWAQVTLRPRVYTKQLLQPASTAPLPTADVDFSGLERALFARLSEANGQLYMLIKYLLLKALPETLPGRVRPFTEVHCRQLMWYLLCSGENRTGSDSLIGRGRRGLQLLEGLLSRQRKSPHRHLALRNFFDQRLGVPFAEAAVGAVDRSVLCRILSSPTRLLTDQVDAYITRLQSFAGGSYFVFRPLLMTVPGCSASLGVPTANQLGSIADYPTVGFRLYRALDILLEEDPPVPAMVSEFSALVDSLRRCATTAAACLRAMMTLKLQQDAKLAHQALMEAGGGQIAVTDCFEATNLTTSLIESALLKTDCAWLYRCKLTKDERGSHETACHGPGGTAFLAAFPQIRCMFFTAHQKPILHSQRCCFEYRLRINFVALWHSLHSQLAREFGSYATSGSVGINSKDELATRLLLEQPDSVVDPQEVVAQVLLCTSSPSRRLLLGAFKSLVVGGAPFHRERGRDEWRWLTLIRLHLMGTWLQELKSPVGAAWSQAQREDCCDLVHWCNQYDEHFHCLAAGCGVSAMLHSAGSAAEVQARSTLQSLLETEMGQAFPLTKESGYDHDLLVVQLYAKYTSDKKARAHFEKQASLLASH